METKKAFDADLENEKSSMFLMGLLIALCASFIVLEWSNKDAKHFTIKDMMPTAIIETDPVPITISTPPPPPPVIEEPQITDPVFKKDEKAETKTTPITGELDPTAETPNAALLTNPVEVTTEVDPGENIIWDYKKVDKTAKYKGNLRAELSRNLVYPRAALEAQITGTVLLRFTVNKDGSIEDIKVIREIDPILAREAVRVLQLLKDWEPAEKDGKKVRSVFQLPVNFSLGR